MKHITQAHPNGGTLRPAPSGRPGRHKQLKEKGIDVSLRDLSWDMKRGATNETPTACTVAPTRRAADPRVVGSTSLTPEEIIARSLQRL